MVGGLVFFQFSLQQSQFLHRLFHAMLVLAQHHLRSAVLVFQRLVIVLEFNYLLLKLVELCLEIVLLLLDVVKFSL